MQKPGEGGVCVGKRNAVRIPIRSLSCHSIYLRRDYYSSFLGLRGLLQILQLKYHSQDFNRLHIHDVCRNGSLE